ncbi:MAG TPA: bifunctional enoyl-CoA hydratase/phosphate acetyltransferase [Bacteroidales bacterium]|jgi:phosphate butyryltransferase|nr:bifunctional enoyl-CoA hydratase/phosphate acetyltransferase [Bacteroidales bacterium]MBP7035530.1 bifunctional enoyl-CoA hydratase/phosphate acetyltransferase [Bacteroidales bacterium]HHU98955.1 bifunctional enoyl-CoA hydratase/phosphate acetyltransferase [Bacteroidales bacterium]HPK85616.1 bifunctional enoyl-CoA hydratase/phosphate acetyltransferase [Bacteroidales bacterium]HPX53757.1 bifunctional enoyl-CoA hydratase/phosphate acetyltransferase [Bacteroidales bacterium]
MALKHLSEFKQLLAGKPARRLVLAAAQDHNSLSSVLRAANDGFIDPILVGKKEEIYNLAAQNNFDLTGVRVVHEPDSEMAIEIAVRMVRSNQADILMKGKVGTSNLLKGVLNKEWGLRSGALLSHIAIFEVEAYHKLIAVTDVAMNIAPNLKDKISIVNNSVACLNKLGIKMPKVAVLGAVEMVTENMQATLDAALLSKMNQRDQIRNCIIDGPLAFDNAISLESANHKGIRSDVAGDTDLLLMPDIEVGNVLYKSLVFFANAGVAAVILGATAPIVLTSRSDSDHAKYYSIVLAAAIS